MRVGDDARAVLKFVFTVILLNRIALFCDYNSRLCAAFGVILMLNINEF